MAVPLTSPVVPSMPLGTSMAMTGKFDALTTLDQARELALDRAGQPGTEQAVNHHIRARDHGSVERLPRPIIALGHGGGVGRQARFVAVEAEAHLVPPLLEMARGDETVAAVIAGTAQDGDVAGVREAARDFFGNGAARVLHQRRAGNAARDGERVGARHFLGRQKLNHGLSARHRHGMDTQDKELEICLFFVHRVHGLSIPPFPAAGTLRTAPTRF